MCGIVGICDHRKSAALCYLGLFSLQHRGQEAAGIVATDGRRLTGRTALGLVAEAFPEKRLDAIRGRTSIGHVRYATAGDGNLRNAQPLVFDTVHGPLAIAHNGTLTNAMSLRRRLEREGAIFRTSADSEVIAHLFARHPGPIDKAIVASLRQVEGAYSLLVLTPDSLFAVRDPMGFRPLCVGRIGRSRIFASETTALNQMNAVYEREIAPGEMVRVTKGSVRTTRPFRVPRREARCIFELIYFSRPDSTVFGRSVQATRRELGRQLAREMAPIPGEIVVPVPDSGVPAALGLSQESGVELEMGFVRSHYIGRTFIQPAQIVRDNSVSLKLSPVRETLRGKRVVLVDDSIVRGTTSRRICRMLRRIGVREVHMAISSPPIISPCHYGIDTPDKAELLAANNTREQERRFLGVDSLHYLTLPGLLKAVSAIEPAAASARRRPPPQGRNGAVGASRSFCTACFTGKYPTRLSDLSAGKTPRALAERSRTTVVLS